MTRKGPLSHEQGSIFKKWTDRVPTCVVFPNTYYVGMSNLAVHILYRTLNTFPEVVCERAFFELGTPALSLESGRPLSSFEIIFLTLSFEMDFLNIPHLLERAGIPAMRKDRSGPDPIVVAGGPCVTADPEPMADFVDLFVMGDIESTIAPFIERYIDLRGRDREEVVEGLSSWAWVYNPAHLRMDYGEDGTVAGFEPPGYGVEILRARGRTLGRSAIITDDTEFAGTYLVEGTRGCPSRCPFCLTGSSRGFVSDPIEDLPEGVKDVGIMGGGVSFHPHLASLITRLQGQGIRVHLPSLRVDEVPLPVIELIKDDVKTLTFGIEAGTERLRRFIGKPLPDQEIYDRIEAIMGMKSFHLKLYFMIGLFGESHEDVERIVELARHVMHVMVKKGARRGSVGSITVHVSPFVPKPATPFQWLPMDAMESLKEKISLLKRGFGKAPNTHFTHESVKHSLLQAVLSRGDRRLTNVIMALSGGSSLTKVMRESALNLNFYATRERGRDEIFPWDFISTRQEKDRLYGRLQDALGKV